MDRTVTKAERAKALRYKKPALASMGYESITSELWDIQEACGDVQWFIDNDDGTLLDALDGNDEEEFEFKMAFADLSGKCEQLLNVLSEWDLQKDFDTCTVALIGNRYNTVGYDGYEEDYFSLCGYDQDLAFSEAGKKLMAKTKKEMISVIGQSLGALISFLDVRQDYDYLKATMDILRGQNRSLIQQLKEFDAAYYAAEAEGFREFAPETRRFNNLADGIPVRMWIE